MRICYACGSKKTRIANYKDPRLKNPKIRHYPIWISNFDEHGNILHYLCARCDGHFRNTSDKKKLQNKTHNKNRIWFRNKFICGFKFNQLTGRCSRCGHEGKTHMHHNFYLITLPWFGREELCISCHRKQTIQDRQMQIERDKNGRIVNILYSKRY